MAREINPEVNRWKILRYVVYKLRSKGWKITRENKPSCVDFESCVVNVRKSIYFHYTKRVIFNKKYFEMSDDHFVENIFHFSAFRLYHEYGHIMLATECYVYWGEEAEQICDYYALRLLGLSEAIADVLTRKRSKSRIEKSENWQHVKIGPLHAKPYSKIAKILGPPQLP